MRTILTKAKDVVVSNTLFGWISAAKFFSAGEVNTYVAIREFMQYYRIEEDDMNAQQLYQIYNRHAKRSRNDREVFDPDHQRSTQDCVVYDSADLLATLKELIQKLENNGQK